MTHTKGVTERELVRKDKIVGVHEEKANKEYNALITVNAGEKTQTYEVLTRYDEIKAALVNDEEWAKKVAKRAVHELQLIAGSEGTTAEIYEAFERRLTEILKGED